MENIFNKLGYSVSNQKKNLNDKTITLLTIYNSDGLPRWIWNAKCSKPLLLKFYNVGSFRATIFSKLIQLIFILKLQKIVFKKSVCYYSRQDNPLFEIEEQWALFTGTIGPNNKAVLYANNSFYKIATTNNAQKLIQKEHDILYKVNGASKTFDTPESILLTDSIIKLSDISYQGKRTKNISDLHVKALLAMSDNSSKTICVKDWSLFQNLKTDLKNIQDKRIPKNLMRKIKTIYEQIDNNETITLSLSQGDFTQWNMFQKANNIAIYDWELASFEKPKAFDYFHFIIQKNILIDRKCWKDIYSELKENNEKNISNPLFKRNELDKYLKWYLLINCIEYLKVYAAQPKWHVQIDWLLQTWSESLNIYLEEKNNTSRELIIMDLFDMLQNKEYATLKFNNGFPEKLSENSDIDIISNKKTNKLVVETLKNHALVTKITTNQKSFMNTLQVFTNQGTLLSIDIIWKIKRKNLVILDAQKLIKNSCENIYGIKSTSAIDTTRYIVLFYILNGAKIPKKFLTYEQTVINSETHLDSIIQDYFTDRKKGKSSLLNFIKKNKQNKGLKFLKNTFHYAIDTFKKIFSEKGFTITFSGVDGAGKSTVIGNIAFLVEKQLRKPVIILRHRPSVLPILSVWTKGKEKAHLDAVSNLPRQGTNNNSISSLLRFTYYYSDYLIGQFVVYFKYISRGYVVIYDRYYFDFINDSRRSNIVLSKNISTFGYKFLLKPKFNFFLFADSDIILNRKKELSKATIEELTKDYSALFSELKAKSTSSIYESINNEKLDVTLNHIVKTIIKA